MRRYRLLRLISSTLIKDGRAATSTTINLPIPAQYWELIQLYQCDAKFKALCDQKANIAAIEWFKNRSETSDSSCGCLKELFIDAQGRIFPCTMLLMERFASQSVHTRPLRQIMPEMLQKWAEIPIHVHDAPLENTAAAAAWDARQQSAGN